MLNMFLDLLAEFIFQVLFGLPEIPAELQKDRRWRRKMVLWMIAALVLIGAIALAAALNAAGII